MKKFVPSEFDKNEHPIQVGKGSLLPGEVAKRAWRVIMREIQDGKPISLPIRIHRGFFDKDHDYSHAYPDRLFSRWIGNPDGNEIAFDIAADGSPTVHLTLISGEDLHGEKVLVTFTHEDITILKRCDKATAVSKGGAISTVAFGVFSVVSETLPVWAEITALLGLAATALQARVRCLIVFKSEESAEKQPFIIADLPEIAFLLLDACCHEPRWLLGTAQERKEASSQGLPDPSAV